MLSRFFASKKRKHYMMSHEPGLMKRNKTSTSSTVIPRSETPSLQDEYVEVSHYVKETMKIETEHLLAQRNPCTVEALATALKNSTAVRKINEPSLPEIDLVTNELEELSLGAKKESALEKALGKLARDPESFTKVVKTWNNAQDVLSTVLSFLPEPEAKPQPDPKDLSLSDYKALLKKRVFRSVQQMPFLRFHASSLLFSQVAQTERRPSQDAGAAKLKLDALDEALAKQIQEAKEEKELRAQNEAVREMEERMVEQERAEEARAMASSLMRPLTAEEQASVNDAIYGLGPSTEVMAQVGTDSVQRGSLHRLQPGQWLNDEVIHYFYIMLGKRDEEMCRLDPKRKRSHFFKSFFVTKLLNEGNANPALDGQYTYSNVKRWSKKVPGKDVFALNKIFFPINQGHSHWVCAVAFMEEKRIQMYDSMRSPGREYLEAIFQYLKDEHQAKKGKPLSDQDQWTLVTTERSTPTQRNGYDCGVFTCMFADFLSKDCPLVFSQEHITQCRERIALSIMNGSALL